MFQVDFYGYDQGDLDATVTFEAHPPTLRAGEDQVLLTDTVFIGEDDNSGGGSQAGLDASETYTLDFTGITPHPVQGFHVKLTDQRRGLPGRRRQAQGLLGHRLRPRPHHHDHGCDEHLGGDQHLWRNDHVSGDQYLRDHHDVWADNHRQGDHQQHLGGRGLLLVGPRRLRWGSAAVHRRRWHDAAAAGRAGTGRSRWGQPARHPSEPDIDGGTFHPSAAFWAPQGV